MAEIDCKITLVKSGFAGSLLIVATNMTTGEIRVHKLLDSEVTDAFPNLPSGTWSVTCQHIDTTTGSPLGPVIQAVTDKGLTAIVVP